LIQTAFESAIVISIMYLHHKCAQIHQEEKKESTIASSVLVSTISDFYGEEEVTEVPAEMLSNFDLYK
jgi:hypothetical protein